MLLDRERQINLITTVETRTADYVRTWLKNPAFKEALRREPKKGPNVNPPVGKKTATR